MADVTIATLNIFNNPHGRWVEREPLIAKQLAELAPDVCAFQEVDRFGDRAAAVIQQTNRELGEERYAMHLLANPSPASIKSLAIATRLGVVTRDKLDLEAQDIAFRAELQLEGDDSDNGNGATFDLVTTHFLYRPTREGGAVRLRQAGQLLDWISSQQERPTVLVGDFNALPTGETIAAIKGQFASAYEAVHGAEPETTQPTPLVYSLDAPKAFGVPELPPDRKHTVDYIFVSGDLTVVDARVVFDKPDRRDATLYPSDHYGLVATVTTPPPGALRPEPRK